MRTIISILTLVLIGTFPVLMHPRSAQAGVDQSQMEPWTDVWKIGGGYRPEMAQIVTSTNYGFFYKVSLYLANVSASGPVIISIQTVIDGEPSGRTIGRGEIPAGALPSYGNPDWVDATIGNVLDVSGTQYAIVVSSPNGTIQWYSSYEDVYSRGFMLFNEGGGWTKWTGDAMFQTHVILHQLDQEQVGQWNHVNVDSSKLFGQTFTAGMTGYLDMVAVQRYWDYYMPDPPTVLYVSIQFAIDGYPSGIEISHGFIPGSSIPSNYPCWVYININPVFVVEGLQYAIVLKPLGGTITWVYSGALGAYEGGDMVYNDGSGWKTYSSNTLTVDAVFKTYVAQPLASSSPPPHPPPPFTFCSDGVCPAVTSTVTPADSTAHITSNVQFLERRDGTLHGILAFNDSRTGEVVLQGCTTDSTACRLIVTTFSCTDQNTITIKGNYTPKGENEHYYELNLSGVKNEIGTFALTLGLPDGDQTYTLTRKGIADVTCPSDATN